MSDQNVVFGLQDPETLKIHFVGTSSSGLGRALQYKSHAKNGNCNARLAEWINALPNQKYLVVTLEVVDAPKTLETTRQKYIGILGGQGHPLIADNVHKARREALWASRNQKGDERRAQIYQYLVKYGPTYETNAQLAEAIGVSVRQISRYINEMVTLNLIASQVTVGQGFKGAILTKRKLSVVESLDHGNSIPEDQVSLETNAEPGSNPPGNHSEDPPDL